MKLLLDTNIVIDYLGRKDPYFAQASQIVASGYFGDTKLYATTNSFLDAFYVLSHYIDARSLQAKMDNLYDVITPVAVIENDLRKAASLLWEDYEDCVVALAAARTGADYLVTRNGGDFERSLIPPITPDEWISMMEVRGFS